MTSAVPLTRGASRDETHAASRYRADIDGLRALAILLVVVYHVWFGRVSGGVDVFLMISAFFLTASFLRRIVAGGQLDIGRYWLRKFRRLLPAAAVTMLLVLAVSALAYPSSEWPGIWRQTWASLFYVQNWQLAFDNVDYYARDEVVPSPLQHFWSLSVQGQAAISQAAPDLVITSMAARHELVDDGSGRDSVAQYVEGLRHDWSQWTAVGSHVLVIADPPLNGDVRGADCVALNAADPRSCARPKAEAQPEDPLAVAATGMGDPAVALFDPTPYFCDADTCYAVVGGVPAYYDADHLNLEYARLLGPMIAAELPEG